MSFKVQLLLLFFGVFVFFFLDNVQLEPNGQRVSRATGQQELLKGPAI